MKHPDSNPADSEAHHHVTQLRNRGVGENAFDVGLRDSDERGKNSGDGSDPRYGFECRRSESCALFR